MTKCADLLSRAQQNPRGMRFRELTALAECHDFVFIRQGGSHEIYKREGYAKNMVFQNVKGMAKAYQVKQLLDALRELGLIE